jgi:hypothetical protein
LELRKRAGELIRAQAVEQEWTRILSVLRNGFLAMPSRMAPALAAAKTPAECEALLRQAIYDALTSISAELSSTQPPNTERV